MHDYDPTCLQRRSLAGDSGPSTQVALWTNHRVMEWLRAVGKTWHNILGDGQWTVRSISIANRQVSLLKGVFFLRFGPLPSLGVTTQRLGTPNEFLFFFFIFF